MKITTIEELFQIHPTIRLDDKASGSLTRQYFYNCKKSRFLKNVLEIFDNNITLKDEADFFWIAKSFLESSARKNIVTILNIFQHIECKSGENFNHIAFNIKFHGTPENILLITEIFKEVKNRDGWDFAHISIGFYMWNAMKNLETILQECRKNINWRGCDFHNIAKTLNGKKL
jgi:hypothetical protein